MQKVTKPLEEEIIGQCSSFRFTTTSEVRIPFTSERPVPSPPLNAAPVGAAATKQRVPGEDVNSLVDRPLRKVHYTPKRRNR